MASNDDSMANLSKGWIYHVRPRIEVSVRG